MAVGPDWADHAESLMSLAKWLFGGLGTLIAALLAAIGVLLKIGFQGIVKEIQDLGGKVDRGFEKSDKRVSHHDVLIAQMRATCDERHGLHRRWDDSQEERDEGSS